MFQKLFSNLKFPQTATPCFCSQKDKTPLKTSETFLITTGKELHKSQLSQLIFIDLSCKLQCANQ